MIDANSLRLVRSRHAQPINAVDWILLFGEGKIITRKALTINENFFTGHFPEQPVFPGAFTLEIVLQSVRYLVYPKSVRLQILRRVRFFAPIFPGDIIECTAECGFGSGNKSLEVVASCSTDKGIAASLKLGMLVEEVEHADSC